MERWTPKIKKSLTEEGMELRMWTDKEGDYVLYKDYADLKSRLAAAREEIKRINDLSFEVIKERNNGKDTRIAEHDLYNSTKQTLEKMKEGE